MLITGPWVYEIVLSAIKQCDLNCMRYEKKGKHEGEFIVITLPCFVISINFVTK
jgi:hypothetical protein